MTPSRSARVANTTLHALVFTEYVRAWMPGATAPESDLFETLWSTLRGVLVIELKKRSLWHASPGYLGIYGPPCWWEDGALDELLASCYTFVFLDRLPTLKAHLKVKDNIEGLVFRCIHNFLYDTQKRHDPLGFRVFEVLQAAIKSCLATRVMYVVTGDLRVRNGTVLGLADDRNPRPRGDKRLSDLISQWTDRLLPDLVTARGKARDRLAESLAEALPEMANSGVEVFRFEEVLAPLKDEIRRRWAAIWAQSEGEIAFDESTEAAAVVLRVSPDRSLEERESFARLLDCIDESLDLLARNPKSQSYLRRLWIFLRNQAAQDGDQKPPSHRKLGELLSIPRERLPELFSLLGQQFKTCREDGSSPPLLSGEGAISWPSQGTSSSETSP